MPLRDHFHPPISDEFSWDLFHGQWPAMIVLALGRLLPPNYYAGPKVHIGTRVEINVATFERGPQTGADSHAPGEETRTTALLAPPRPTLDVRTDRPTADEYEIQVFDASRGRQLVAAIEIVSPSNKDRPESRRDFVAKCASLLRQNVSVSVIDLVTERHFNLYADLLDFFGQSDPQFAGRPDALYAVTCSGRTIGPQWALRTWAYPMDVGRPLPTLPILLTAQEAVSLELEPTYEDTCRALRMI